MKNLVILLSMADCRSQKYSLEIIFERESNFAGWAYLDLLVATKQLLGIHCILYQPCALLASLDNQPKR